MPDVHEDIRSWLRQQPDWIQQAAEILLASGSASDDDIQALAERLKTPEGQQVTATRSFDGLGPAAASANTLRLVEIGDISGIENLNPRRPLAFGDGNLSVIYGHNGSGKSGYTRLLKRACGKPRAAVLKPNVFEAPPASRKCRIAYAIDGEKRQPDWLATGGPIDELRAVDIFDTDSALFYLRQETTGAYNPPAVALFEALASVCDRIKARLNAEQQALISALPTSPGEYVGTEAGKAFHGLTAGISEAEAQQLTEWSEADEQSLARVNQRLGIADPATLARNERGSKVQVDVLANLLKSVAAAFGEPGLAEIRTKRETAQTRRRIAAESAQVSSAKLEGVGSDTWRAMWEAARSYSQVAYSGRDYPVTDGDGRCVLCQQSLDGEARGRLGDFEALVQDVLEKEANTAETTYQQALTALPNALTTEQITTRCQAAGLTEEEWTQQLGAFWQQVIAAHQALLEGEANGAAVPSLLPDELAAALAWRSETLEREATQHEQDATDFDRVQAAKDKLELEARCWMAQQAEAIRGEIGRLRQYAEYTSWQRLANSRPVSLKAGEIAEQVVTQAFVDRFNRELKALGASRIRVELIKTRTERGKVLHKIRLKGAHTGHDIPDAVLSEGERRVVGLAAFLADVADQPHSAPFVFDDPISSLDHDFEWHVAVRLAQLAHTRQVLVFTHRLSLYGAMEDAAKKLGDEWKRQHLVKHCIESYSGVAGHPVDQDAWNANTKKANNILLDRLEEARKAGDNGGADAYRQQAQGICSDFRKLLERTVEEDLLNGIVKRHRRSITTDNLLKPLPNITSEDCKLIDDLMTKYSCYEHSQSQETPAFLPEEPELRADFEALKKWRDDFKKRPTEAAA
jgi:energy-coupling factor transporter ATP-binding protein EcfA2